ncbi:MAG: hypothetical protein ACFFFG_01670 [Candidatus Thorarchaeota archaeon]
MCYRRTVLIIHVTLTFFASLQDIFPENIDLQIPEPTPILHIFPLFNTKLGQGADTIFLEGKSLKPDFIVLMDGRNIHALDGIFTTITQSCEISFFPPIGGGCSIP